MIKTNKVKQNKNVKTKRTNKPNKMDRTSYEVVAVSTKSASRQPRTIMRAGGTVVQHTETYGQNIVGTSTFSISNAWAIQPGISSYSRGEPLGVWLPQIAGNFDNYEIESLKFRYRTACSTLTPGLAVFAFEPNPEGTMPTTYQEMRNMMSIDGSIHTNLVFDVSAKVKGRRLIRKGQVVNLPSYDLGKVYFATIGVTENALCGFIDVEYSIRLINPQAAQTSTDGANAVTSSPVAPVQRWECDYGGTGIVNCAASSAEVWNYMVAGARPSTGASLASVITQSIGAYNVTLLTGNKFVSAASPTMAMLRIAKKGRYCLRFQPRVDWEDLKMFSLTLYHYFTGGNRHCTKQVYSSIDGGPLVNLPTEILAHRGFTGTAVNDPNPGTEVHPVFEFNFDADKDNFDVMLRIGVLIYNDVSTTTANVRGRSGLGDSVFELQYLGPYLDSYL